MQIGSPKPKYYLLSKLNNPILGSNKLLIEAMALKAIAPIAIFSTIVITVFTVWFDLPADFIVNKMVTCPN